MKTILLTLCILFANLAFSQNSDKEIEYRSSEKQFHVAKSGNDKNKGSLD